MSARPTQRAVSRPWLAAVVGLAWISPWVIGFTAFTLLPVAISGYLCFCQFDGLRPPLFTGLENLRTLAADPVFWQTLKTTSIYAAIALPLGTLVALALAVLLNANVPGRTVWRAIIFVPTLVPLVATAMIWLWMFNGQYGLLNAALAPLTPAINLVLDGLNSLLGAANFVLRPLHPAVALHVGRFEPPNWLTDPHWTMPSMILLSVWSVGNAVVVYLAGLQDVPRSLYEAAHVDGANAWQRLRHVTLPMISPSIFFNIVIGIIFVWQVFAVPQIMIPGGGPQRSAYFYTMYLYDTAFRDLRFGYASTLSWVQLAIIVALTALAFRLSRRLVHYRGTGG